MGILSDYNLDEIPEVSALPAGEYEVVIQKAEDYVGKTSGKQSIRVLLDVPDEANADTIFHYIALPNSEDTEKTRNNKLRRLKEFLKAFDLSQDDDYNDWVGHKSWSLVKQETDQDGNPRNSVQRFLGRSDNSNIEPPAGSVNPFETDNPPF